MVCIVLLCNSRFYIQLIAFSFKSCTKMFSYALRQIQPRSVSPSRARLPVIAVVDSSAFPGRRGRIRGETITSYADRGSWEGAAPLLFLFSLRARRARDPVSRGKNEADPRVGYHCYFFFCSQTARQLVFCLSIFISAVTSVYYCWYLLLCYVCVCSVTVYNIRVLV